MLGVNPIAMSAAMLLGERHVAQLRCKAIDLAEPGSHELLPKTPPKSCLKNDQRFEPAWVFGISGKPFYIQP
jgi:hypothetical protein